jgi:hypothetical protein
VNPRYRETAARAAHRCEYCRAPEVAFNFPFEVEHVTPAGLGGNDEPENLALSCRSCNIFKGNQHSAIDSVTGETVRLFHPRTDLWAQHFMVADNKQVIGLTAIGRASVDLLRMNTPPQLNARYWWRALQLFP